MMRGMACMVCVGWMVAMVGIAAGEPVKDHSRFCSGQAGGWLVRDYPPLVDTKAGTSFTEFVFAERDLWVSHVYVKRYTDRFELMYDYRFGEDGRLSGLHGLLRRWGRWMGEADLFPETEGSAPELSVQYRLRQDGGVIQAPEDGPEYTDVFRSVTVYRTVAEVPCARAVQAAGR